jgi:hypothetical protein
MKLQGLLRSYVESESNSQSWDVSMLHEFVDKLAEELTEVYKVDKIKMKVQGFDSNPVEQFSYANKVALLENKEE